MNMQNFTQKSIEALTEAQKIALQNQNMQIEEEHLLQALVNQQNGFIPELFKKMNINVTVLKSELDNAIEAVRHLPAEKQEIDLVVKVTKGILKFIVENPYQGSIKENRQGQILTGKKDSQNHGIGLSSVRRAVEKYNGELTVQYEENIFRTMVMLYLPENLPSKA